MFCAGGNIGGRHCAIATYRPSRRWRIMRARTLPTCLSACSAWSPATFFTVSGTHHMREKISATACFWNTPETWCHLNVSPAIYHLASPPSKTEIDVNTQSCHEKTIIKQNSVYVTDFFTEKWRECPRASPVDKETLLKLRQTSWSATLWHIRIQLNAAVKAPKHKRDIKA